MVRVMSLTRRVPPERTSLGSVTVALGGGVSVCVGGQGGNSLLDSTNGIEGTGVVGELQLGPGRTDTEEEGEEKGQEVGRTLETHVAGGPCAGGDN